MTRLKTNRNLKKAYPAGQKERGEWVELLFMANAARLGLKVARPHGDSARFDVIVEGGGRMYRVQVKSTVFNRNGCYECLCFWSRVSKKRESKPYSEEQIDLVAAYVVPEECVVFDPGERVADEDAVPAATRAGGTQQIRKIPGSLALARRDWGKTDHPRLGGERTAADADQDQAGGGMRTQG
jgi:PD-(D/E)XK endonuclease